MADRDDWVSILCDLVRRMAATEVTELELQQGDLRLRLRRGSPVAARAAAADQGGAVGSEGPELHRVKAPLTGVYYSAPSPGSEPFVRPGDWVEHTTVVGLIETMKVFNQVMADCRGRVETILVRQGQLVHAGEPILLVDMAALPDHDGEVADGDLRGDGGVG